MGDAALVAQQQQVGRFNDGRAHGYAFGLMVNTGNVRVVEHSGSTAGYSAHLLRYPDQHISVANTARATQYAHDVSDEAEATLVAAIDGESLVLKRRPDTTITLTPVYADGFDAPRLGLVIFRRDASGRVTALGVNQDRVWDLRFVRQTPMTSTAQRRSRPDR